MVAAGHGSKSSIDGGGGKAVGLLIHKLHFCHSARFGAEFVAY
jgi:hypothetical protein